MSEPGGLKSQIESAIDRKLNYWGQRPSPGELYIVCASLVGAFNMAKAALTYRRFGLADRAVKSNAPDAELIIYEAGLREASDVEWAMKYRKQFLRVACIRCLFSWFPSGGFIAKLATMRSNIFEWDTNFDASDAAEKRFKQSIPD
jgi:hypothetical protein